MIDAAPAPNDRGRVLLVDDEPGLAQSLARYITAAGFSCEVALNGTEAAARLGNGFDLIVSDITMPGLDGIGLLRLVREHDLDIPVILLTGTPSVETAAKAVDLGATRYLIKPVERGDLVAAVRAAVRLRRFAKVKREALDLLAGGGIGLGDTAALSQIFDSALSSLWMAFQPVVSWKSREIYGYEALVRTKESRLPHPGALFDAAERLGRVNELGMIIRDAAATGFANAPVGTNLFINLHILDLNEVSLYLTTTPLAKIASRVILEITERASVDEVRNLRARVAVLRGLGYRIAIDDMGAGYAGLTSFALLEPEVVKLDMTLVRDLHREPIKGRIVKSMVALCTESNMLVVAEGIETVEERDELARLGCDLMQGYLFARPGQAFPTVEWS